MKKNFEDKSPYEIALFLDEAMAGAESFDMKHNPFFHHLVKADYDDSLLPFFKAKGYEHYLDEFLDLAVKRHVVSGFVSAILRLDQKAGHRSNLSDEKVIKALTKGYNDFPIEGPNQTKFWFFYARSKDAYDALSQKPSLIDIAPSSLVQAALSYTHLDNMKISLEEEERNSFHHHGFIKRCFEDTRFSPLFNKNINFSYSLLQSYFQEQVDKKPSEFSQEILDSKLFDAVERVVQSYSIGMEFPDFVENSFDHLTQYHVSNRIEKDGGKVKPSSGMFG